MTMQTIPLDRLIPSPANVRKMKTRIEGLAASIEAHGLLQNLQVRAATDEHFEVVAGGRRFEALTGWRSTRRSPVIFPCRARCATVRTQPKSASPKTRCARRMHPADQFEAFKKLADEDKGEEEIAARFGVTPQIVRQRLKLAVVSPKLIAAYRKGDMTLDCLMAFTVTDDPKQQEKDVEGAAGIRAAATPAIRDALTEKHIAADSKLAEFVGVEAYEKAGGAVLRDLFDDENAGWLTDPALVHQLAAAQLEQAADAVRGEGWKWVEIVPDLDWEVTRVFGNAEPVTAAADRRAAAGDRGVDGGVQRPHRRAWRRPGGHHRCLPPLGHSGADRGIVRRRGDMARRRRKPLPGPSSASVTPANWTFSGA